MIKITNPSDCCGCTACASVCNRTAISMKPDALGFLFPVVDLDKCANCGLCERICSFNEHYDISLNLMEPIAYGARHRDMNEVQRSRSGAAFAAITDYILSQGGVIYGAGYKEHFRVVHKRATTREERDEFRGSKYVQSDLSGIFHLIKQDLIDGKIVLFSGTGCQTAGLNSFVGKKLRSSLILVDIVCHGVPGPYLWRDFLSHLEKQKGARIMEVNFRDKKMFGWRAHRETFKYVDSKEMEASDFNFYKRIMLRHSCNKCYFCNTRRPSDITLADFWGWEKQGVELNKDDKGLNLVLVNTERGKQILSEIKDCLLLFDADRKYYLQPNLCHPTAVHPYRQLFEIDYKKKGFEYVFFKNYDVPSVLDRIRKKMFDIIKATQKFRVRSTFSRLG